jgi:Glyoxalase-like domain
MLSWIGCHDGVGRRKSRLVLDERIGLCGRSQKRRIPSARGDGPRLHLDETDRMHLDLWAEDQVEQGAEVERLISLGAKRVEWDYPDDADFVVLADPEGNLFCVRCQPLILGSATTPRSRRHVRMVVRARDSRRVRATRMRRGNGRRHAWGVGAAWHCVCA